MEWDRGVVEQPEARNAVLRTVTNNLMALIELPDPAASWHMQ
jgi:hypothetical protein